MKVQIALAGAMLVATALPALAETDYFIVQGPDHHCQVVDQRPVEKDMTIVGPNGVTYHSRTEATTAMKTVKVCE
ncbi:MAG TPA: hypothetical protein VMI30_03945 [Stellaceae bacterium]|nr:hypothetical protein [Stellaceae bacterium]